MTIYYSTRNKNHRVSSTDAILNGIAPDGGLFVPEIMPTLPLPLEQLVTLDYKELAFHILKVFLSDFTNDELRACINAAYNDTTFDDALFAPLKQTDGNYYLELFHGQTIAFKDMALSILPHLMTTAAQKNNIDKDILILTATSGDTGKAAMAGFADVPHTKIIVFYPKGAVSPIQERQMLTQTGNNTHVIGIKGNFDDAQSAVKQLFLDKKLQQTINELGYQFSSANSINIGRLVPQIVYYIYAYAQLVQQNVIAVGEVINVSVPTGNFGNILAAYFAKQMGLPIKTLLCASNRNNVLSDFFNTHRYDKNRPFYVTNSPSMDILISSNLERLIFAITQNNDVQTKALMDELQSTGTYTITPDMAEKLTDFYAGYCDDATVLATIKDVFLKHNYVIDPHTAVAQYVYNAYKNETNDNTPTIIVSTASAYKFPNTVMHAISEDSSTDDFYLCDRLEDLSHVPQPFAIEQAKNGSILHDTVVAVDKIYDSVLDVLK